MTFAFWEGGGGRGTWLTFQCEEDTGGHTHRDGLKENLYTTQLIQEPIYSNSYLPYIGMNNNTLIVVRWGVGDLEFTNL